jgi:hypothetical protein
MPRASIETATAPDARTRREMTVIEIEHANRSGKPGGLGRHVNHDPMSRSFAHRPSSTTLVSKIWDRHYAVLDQGQTGSCTGNAELGAIYTGNVFSALTDALKAKYQPTEGTARDVLYHLATQIDGFPGTYPPNDTGSDGVSVSKAAQQLGLISGYRHTFSLDDALATLSNDAHVITGVNWYGAFDTPDAEGLVRLPKTLGRPEGGHEFLVYGLDVTKEEISARNSWGSGWGVAGEFKFSFTDWGRLLKQQGDVTVPVPISAPAPTPTPTPIEPSWLTALKADFAAAVAWIEAHI